MKRQVFPVLILLLVLLLPALTGCPQDAGGDNTEDNNTDGQTPGDGTGDDNTGTTPGGYLGDTLVFKGQISTATFEAEGGISGWTDAYDVIYEPFTASGTVEAGVEGNNSYEKLAEGPLTEGGFDLSITAEPGPDTLTSISAYWAGSLKATVVPPEARFTSLSLVISDISTEDKTGLEEWIERMKITTSGDATAFSRKEDIVEYWYVDRDAVATVAAFKPSPAEDSGKTATGGYNAVKLELRKGWNAVHIENEISGTATTVNMEMSMSVGNPEGLYWQIESPRPAGN